MTDFSIGARIKGNASSFENAMKSSAAAAAGLGSSLRAVGVTLTAFAGAQQLGAAVKAATEFEAQMLRLDTLVGIQPALVARWADSLRELAPELGRTAVELSRTMFTITSGGIRDADEALRVLEQSGKAAAIGLGDAAKIGRTAGAALQAFRHDSLTAQRAVDIMVATVREGNLVAENLAGSLGRVLGPAATLGVTFEEMNAFIATFTRLGISAEEATTSLLGVFNIALQPPEQVREAMEGAGFAIEDFRRAIQDDGLTSALQQMLAAAEGNLDVMGKMMPNVRALAGVLGTAGVQADAYNTILKNIQESAGLTDEGFRKWSETAQATFARFEASVESARITWGARFLPAITFGLDTITKSLDALLIAIAAVTAAVAPLIAMKVATVVTGWGAAIATAAAAAAAAAAPIAVIIAGFTALAAVLAAPFVITWKINKKNLENDLEEAEQTAIQAGERIQRALEHAADQRIGIRRRSDVNLRYLTEAQKAVAELERMGNEVEEFYEKLAGSASSVDRRRMANEINTIIDEAKELTGVLEDVEHLNKAGFSNKAVKDFLVQLRNGITQSEEELSRLQEMQSALVLERVGDDEATRRALLDYNWAMVRANELLSEESRQQLALDLERYDLGERSKEQIDNILQTYKETSGVLSVHTKLTGEQRVLLLQMRRDLEAIARSIVIPALGDEFRTELETKLALYELGVDQEELLRDIEAAEQAINAVLEERLKNTRDLTREEELYLRRLLARIQAVTAPEEAPTKTATGHWLDALREQWRITRGLIDLDVKREDVLEAAADAQLRINVLLHSANLSRADELILLQELKAISETMANMRARAFNTYMQQIRSRFHAEKQQFEKARQQREEDEAWRERIDGKIEAGIKKRLEAERRAAQRIKAGQDEAARKADADQREAERRRDQAVRNLVSGLQHVNSELSQMVALTYRLVDALKEAETTSDKIQIAGLAAAGLGSVIGGQGGNAVSLVGGGAATGAMVGGPIGAAVGATVGAIASLVSWRKAENEEIKKTNRALQQNHNALLDLRDQLSGLPPNLDAISTNVVTTKAGLTDFSDETRRFFASLNIDVQTASYDQLNAAIEYTLALRQRELAYYKRDLQARALRAQGFDFEADLAEKQLQFEREYDEARAKGADDATLATLGWVQGLELVNMHQEALNQAASDFKTAVDNVNNALLAQQRITDRIWEHNQRQLIKDAEAGGDMLRAAELQWEIEQRRAIREVETLMIQYRTAKEQEHAARMQVEAAQLQLEAVGGTAPGLFGLNLDNDPVWQALLAWLAEIMSGTFDGLKSLGDEAKRTADELSRLRTDVPRIINVALLEQKYGTSPGSYTGGIRDDETGIARPGTGTGGGVTVNGNITINSSATSAAGLLRDVQREATRVAARGGSVISLDPADRL